MPLQQHHCISTARNSWFWKHKWCVQTATGTGTKISNTVDLRKLKTNLTITSLIALVDCETKPKFNTFHPSRQKHENNLVLQVVTSFGPIAVTFSGLFCHLHLGNQSRSLWRSWNKKDGTLWIAELFFFHVLKRWLVYMLFPFYQLQKITTKKSA